MKDRTKLVTAGRPKTGRAFPVNAPVERASTILFPTYDDFIEGGRRIAYGRLGASTHRALEEAITALEGGFETRLAPSGLQAVNAAMLAFLKAGDHALIVDSAYDPTRKFADRFLSRFGVAVEYYDPRSGGAIASKIRAETRVIFAESPGSLTFEVQDLPALAAAANAAGVRLIVDNTWSGGFFLKPIALGAHVSVQAGTKYLSGHSDCLIGSITSCDEETARDVFQAVLQLGSNVAADDAYLTLRGMRTLAVRMTAQQEAGLAVARYLAGRPEVKRVLYPALPDDPGHALWRRDFTGASSLFGVVLHPVELSALKNFFNALKLFGMGFSWGGFESLCIHARPESCRTASPWREPGPLLRFHIGLEEVGDLIADLDNAFSAMATANG